MAEKILVISPAWVGDMVMAQSLLRAIKAQTPQAQIDVLAPHWCAPLTSRMPEVDNTIGLPVTHGELKLGVRYAIGRKLRSSQYTRCFVLPNSFKSALIPFWARIPQRIGWVGEARYLLLNQVRALDQKRYPLMVQRYTGLLSDHIDLKAVRPRLVPTVEGVQAALEKHQLTHHSPILALCPGAEYGPSKQWPAAYFAKLAAHYVEQGCQVWILGSAKDKAIASLIEQEAQVPIKNLAGRTTLLEAVDLLSAASAVVSNDSGLMHIAAALDRPVIAIYGSTDASFTPPCTDKMSMVQEKLHCTPCFRRVCPLGHHDCMNKIYPTQVIAAVENWIKG